MILVATLKFSLWTAALLLLLRLLPGHAHQLRRHTALTAAWGAQLLPWLQIQPHAHIWPISVTPPIHSSPWVPAAGTLWLLGSTYALWRLCAEWLHWQHCIKHAAATADPQLLISDHVPGPCVVGIIRPRILMPTSATQWPAAHWRAALRHEQQHLAQRDVLHRSATALLRVIWWWHPLAHLVSQQVELETEVSCDLAAAQADPTQYGHMLLHMATHPLPGAIAWAQPHSLSKRITRLLLSKPTSIVLYCIACAALAFALALTLTLSQADQVEARLRWTADPFPAQP
jgi:hypothetical protein